MRDVEPDLAASEGPVRRDHRPVGAERRRPAIVPADTAAPAISRNLPRTSSRPSRRSKLATGMAGPNASPPQLMSSTARARKQLKALGRALDGIERRAPRAGSRSGRQRRRCSTSPSAPRRGGPRFLSPKPLDNMLNSANVPLPTLSSKLPALAAQQQFVDVDVDQLNRLFFQAVDELLAPAPAALAFEAAPAAYTAIALGRETLAAEIRTVRGGLAVRRPIAVHRHASGAEGGARRVRAADACGAVDRLFGRHDRPVRRHMEPAGFGGRRRQHRAVRPDRGGAGRHLRVERRQPDRDDQRSRTVLPTMPAC